MQKSTLVSCEALLSLGREATDECGFLNARRIKKMGKVFHSINIPLSASKDEKRTCG